MATKKKVTAAAAGGVGLPGLPLKLPFRRDEIDWELIDSGFAAVASQKMVSGKDAEGFARLERRGGFLMRHASRRAARMFERRGGDLTDIQSFMEWLIANWDEILKMVMSIIQLFAVV